MNAAEPNRRTFSGLMLQSSETTPAMPDACQLLALTGITSADNPWGLTTSFNWQSDLAGLWLQGVYGWRQLLADCSHSPWLPGALARACDLQHHQLERWILNPIRKGVRQAAAKLQQPDPFRAHNSEIERRYAALLGDLCRLFLNPQGEFDLQISAQRFNDPADCWKVFALILQLGYLERSYHSEGLTRLTALKELYKTLLMAITGTPLPGPHPYRHYPPDGKPTDSFEDYLQQLHQRLQCLARMDAFDMVHLSRQPFVHIGASEYQWVEDADSGFDAHGAKLRHYPAKTGGAARRRVLYLNSPLINRPEIFDLAPGKSVIEGLIGAGFEVYLTDFSSMARTANNLGLGFFGKSIHDHFLSLIKARHPDAQIDVMGYCMGGTLILPYLARRAEERERQGLSMDIGKLLLMATPVKFDDEHSGHKPMRDLIRTWYDADMLQDLLGDEMVPPQLINSGMNQVQPGIRYTVTRGFFERATSETAVRDSAPFLHWLNHGTPFPAEAHRQWIRCFFLENQLWNGKFALPSTEAELDNQPVDMGALTRGEVKIMDYRGERDPISPKGSCLASEIWGCNGHRRAATGARLNRTIEKNIGHIFVVSRTHLADYLNMALEFYLDGEAHNHA